MLIERARLDFHKKDENEETSFERNAFKASEADLSRAMNILMQ